MPHKNTIYHICTAVDGHIHIGIDSNIISVFQIDSISSHHTGFRCFQVQLFRVNNRFYIRRHSYRRPITAAGGNIDCLSCKVISQVLAISAYLTDRSAEYLGILLIIESNRTICINNVTARIFFGRIDVLTLTGPVLERYIACLLCHGGCCQSFSNFYFTRKIGFSIFIRSIKQFIRQCIKGGIYQILIFCLARICIQSPAVGTHRNTGTGFRISNYRISADHCCRRRCLVIINKNSVSAVMINSNGITVFLGNYTCLSRRGASCHFCHAAACKQTILVFRRLSVFPYSSVRQIQIHRTLVFIIRDTCPPGFTAAQTQINSSPSS